MDYLKHLSVIWILVFVQVLSSQELPPSPNVDAGENWTSTISYALNGQTLSKGINYYNNLGKPIQNQNWDLLTHEIWANKTFYDSHSRPALTTSSAPIGVAFGLNTNSFILNTSNAVYGLSDFENESTPSGVSNTSLLGSYYYNNANDQYQDNTIYPFSRTVYSKLRVGEVQALQGGNTVDGDWLQTYSFTMIAGQELSQPEAFGSDSYNDYKILKAVSRDVHGIETVVFIDSDGNTLASARSGNEDASNSISYDNTLKIKEQGWVDFHIPNGVSGLITIEKFVGEDTTAFEIYDLITEQLVLGVDIDGVSSVTRNLNSGFYRISINGFDLSIESHRNLVGNIEVTHQQNYYDYALNYYDRVGRLKRSTQPLGEALESMYTYNSLGQLLETSSPDEGTAKFKYRKDGQIRFSQNSKQALEGELSFTDYDSKGRPIRSGVLIADFESLDADTSIINSTYTMRELNHTIYDLPDTALLTSLARCGIPANAYKQTFLYGNISKTYTEAPDTNYTWYSYDVYGRVKWLIQEVKGLNCYKTIDYTYDPITGQVTKVDYQRHNSTERFIHKYEYNVAGQLTRVSSSRNDQTYTENAKYFYTETGALKRTEIAEDLQGIDYVYNISGQLKAINSPLANGFKDPGNDGNNGFKADVFGMLIDYHDEDYSRQGTHLNGLRNPMTNNQLNGNIGGVRWHNSTNPVSMQTDAYTYSYNKNNWLQTAKYGKATHNSTAVTFTQDTHKDYEVSNVSYDANGNLLHLKRNGVTDSAGNNHMDAFTYHYESNTNQLSSVEDLNDNNDPNRFNDLKNQYQSGQDNYIYNDIGQLVSNLQDNIYYEYNASGLVDCIKTIGASNSGDLATLYFEDYTNATAEDVIGWTDNNTDASGAGAFSGFSINHGTYKVGEEKCVYLSETYENSLNVVLPNGVTAMRSFDVHADVQHVLDLDIIVSQSAVLFAGEVPSQYHIGYHIRVKDANGTVLATETINNPPQIITNDLPDGSSDTLVTTCDYFYDNHHHLSFTPTNTTVQLEIEMITPDAPTAILNIDNIHLQASAVPKLAFYYNDRGHRIKKQAYTGAGGYTTTYYIRDVAGNPMAIYEAYQPDGRGMYQPPTPKEYPVYGNSRLGVYFKDTSSKSGGHYVYQLADHLGNVRAVVMKSGNNSLSLTNKTDYYPFGMPMPNRNIEGNYRYGYQGEFAEKEPELGNGQNSFELRLWDNRIGRWLTTDPARQYVSPYLGMGNNPISRIDPDGGTDDWIYDPDSDIYYWDENVTFDDRSAMTSGHEYVGVAWSDITDYFNNNNNWFVKKFTNPDIDTRSFKDYIQKSFNNSLQTFLETGVAQRFDNVRGLYENWHPFFGGAAEGLYEFPTNLCIDGETSTKGSIIVQIFRTHKKWNVINNVIPNHKKYNGKIISEGVRYPYQWRIYSGHMLSDDRIPIFTLLVPFSESNFSNALDNKLIDIRFNPRN